MAKITMDGKEYVVSDGISVVQAAAEVGVVIPHYCYHPALRAPANCRMCLIELTPPGAPGPLRQLATACTTRVSDGMVIGNLNPRVKAARAATLEFLLVHHPLDCPTCDQSGECDLQDFSFQFGKDESRYAEAKNVPPRKTLGPFIELFSTRCVVCTRCVRFCEEVTGTAEIGLINRGGHNEIDVYAGKPLDNLLSGNVADICPVGALVSRDFLYKSRPWFLKKVNSICSGCSKGCNITVEFREGEVVRLKPRYNADVNDFWMCDDGRHGYPYVNRRERLKHPAIRKDGELVPTGWNRAFETIANTLREIGSENVALVGSAYDTNETLYLTGRIAREALGTERIGLLAKPITGEDIVYPKFTIEKDKNPNRTGGRLLLSGETPVAEDDALWSLLSASKAAIIFSGIPDLSLSDAALKALKGLDFLVVVDILPSALTEHAHIVCPGTSFAEKEGCFTNSQRRVQRVHHALSPVGNSLPEWVFVQQVARSLGRSFECESVGQITDEIASNVPVFAGATSEAIGTRGFVLGTDAPVSEENRRNYAYATLFWK
jgi:NADH-quinone oxidoreductase subunit G